MAIFFKKPKCLSATRKIRGFTLVELMVAISILALLSTVALVAYSGVRKSARDAKRREEIKMIVAALEVYRAQNGDYPPMDDDDGTADACVSNFGELNVLVPEYIKSIPEDPSFSWGNPATNYCYFLRKGPGNGIYTLYARLEANSAVTADCSSKLYREEISQFNLCQTQP